MIGAGVAGSVMAVIIAFAIVVLVVRRLRGRRSVNQPVVDDAEKAVMAGGTLVTAGAADGCADVSGGNGDAAGAAVLASLGLTDRAFPRRSSTVIGASNNTPSTPGGDVGGAGGGSMTRRTGGCLAVAAACRSALTLSNDGAAADGHGGSDRRQGQAACCVHATAAVAAGCPSPVVGVQLVAGGGYGGEDGHGGSAFSMSFAAGDMALGKAPTMLEQLLGREAGRAPGPQGVWGALPQLHQPRLQQPLSPGQPTFGIITDAAMLAGGGVGGGGARGRAVAAAAAAAAAAAGRNHPGQVVGPCADPDNEPNNGNYGDGDNANRKTGGVPDTNDTITKKTPSRGAMRCGSSHGETVQRALAGEIDGLIRRFEATSQHASGPQSGNNSHRHRVLGSGGFGVVYKGEWRGLPVAIKVVLLQDGDSATRRERLVREVALSATLSHPNIVPTYHYTIQPVAATGAAGAAPSWMTGHHPRVTNMPEACGAAEASPTAAGLEADGGVMAYKLSIFMAYCDRGTLRDALRTGAFRRPWPPPQLVPATAALPLSHGGKAGAASRRHTRQRGGSDATPTVGGRGGATSSSGDGNLVTPYHLQPLSPENPGPMGPGTRVLLQPLPDTFKEELVAVAAALGAVQQDAESPRPLRQLTGGGPGREGRLESWQDLRAAPNQALALFAALDVARGLDYLHSCNVVHGDLSLQNILLTSTESFFPELAIMASTSTSAALAATTAAFASTGGGGGDGGSGGGGSGGDAAAAAGPSAGSQVAAHVLRGVINRLPEEPPSCSTGNAAVEKNTATTGAVTARRAGGGGRGSGGGGGDGTSDGAIAPRNNSLGARSVEEPPKPPPPSRPEPQETQPVMATVATLAAALLTAAEHSTETASGDYDASAEDPEGMGGTTVSTNTRSCTIGGLSVGTDGATLTPWASLGGGRRRAMTVPMRLALVQPLLGQVFKISDFGLSVRLEEDETHRSGLHQGTPYYTPTEVLLSGKLSPAADVYSYGVCLWCLVHGVSLCQIRHLLPPVFTPVAPTLLAHLAPELHPGLRSLVRRCLSGEAGRRPTAAALVVELHGLMQAVLGPELAPLLLCAERRERDAGRVVAGSLMLDSANGMGPGLGLPGPALA
ncbi:hypothetical protein Vretimale_9066 [Volvox reticuliferus]|nr:hypothetical protein Vretimale_9066 [Volvox reticuliferus]